MRLACIARCVLGAVMALAAFTQAFADDIEALYAERTLSMVIPTSPGGDVDGRARLVARFMGRQIPGKPTIVPRNMPGAVGLQAANWLHALAPRDGTAIQAVMQSMPTHQLLDGGGVQFDAREFNWIGNTSDEPNTIVAWSTTGIRKIEDVKHRELVVGAPGTYTNCVFYPLLMNALVGTRFKIISGYPAAMKSTSPWSVVRSVTRMSGVIGMVEHKARMDKPGQDHDPRSGSSDAQPRTARCSAVDRPCEQ